MTLAIKICGITRPEDAAAAAALGATHIGINFWPGSRRHVTVDQARPIVAVLPAHIVKVGVFVDATPAEVSKIAVSLDLDLVQFHGDENLVTCEIFTGRYIRALRVTAGAPLDPRAYPGAVALLLDAPSPGYGGSGHTFDWSLARALGARPFFLAGGLHPGNVAEAVRAVRPFGVDVASGVEQSPGIKDPDKLRRFIAAAKEAAP